jgi:hypothetical protein
VEGLRNGKFLIFSSVNVKTCDIVLFNYNYSKIVHDIINVYF